MNDHFGYDSFHQKKISIREKTNAKLITVFNSRNSLDIQVFQERCPSIPSRSILFSAYSLRKRGCCFFHIHLFLMGEDREEMGRENKERKEKKRKKSFWDEDRNFRGLAHNERGSAGLSCPDASNLVSLRHILLLLSLACPSKRVSAL